MSIRMVAAMEFKKSSTVFESGNHFKDEMKRFVAEEAKDSGSGHNEAASADLDEAAEKILRISSEKNKKAAAEHKKILKELKNEEFVSSKNGDFADKMRGQIKGAESSGADTVNKEADRREREAKKTRKKEQKKAASKTAVATMLRAKKDMSNDLSSDKATGNAFSDGQTGLLKTFSDLLNPVRWLKSFLVHLAMILAPFAGVFLLVAVLVIIIVMFLFSVLQPMGEVGDALNRYLQVVQVESDTFRNTAFSEEEIDEIVEESGCDETEEKVLRFALSKVGFPYSQANRTSGAAYDCSSLAYYAWEKAGYDISYGTGYPPSAAEGARMLESRDKKLSVTDLKPGDLIYYGGRPNGRYMGIYHVAIYAGKGKAVEAYNETYGVIYQNLRTENAVMVCRPDL